METSALKLGSKKTAVRFRLKILLWLSFAIVHDSTTVHILLYLNYNTNTPTQMHARTCTHTHTFKTTTDMTLFI